MGGEAGVTELDPLSIKNVIFVAHGVAQCRRQPIDIAISLSLLVSLKSIRAYF